MIPADSKNNFFQKIKLKTIEKAEFGNDVPQISIFFTKPLGLFVVDFKNLGMISR